MRKDGEREIIRRPGRPKCSHVYYSKCDVRLTKNENNMLDYLSELNGTTRSTIMRKALRDFYKFNTDREE